MIRVLIADDQDARPRRLADDPRRPGRLRRSSARPPTGPRPSRRRRELRPDVVLMDVRMPGLRRDRGDRASCVGEVRAHARADADHVRSGRVRLRGAARGRERFPAQGRSAATSWSTACAPSRAGDALLAPAITRRADRGVRRAGRRRRPPLAARARRADRARARGAAAGRPRAVQRRDRRRAGRQRGHRQDATSARILDEARAARSRAGGRVRLRVTAWSNPIRSSRPCTASICRDSSARRSALIRSSTPHRSKIHPMPATIHPRCLRRVTATFLA